MRGLRSGPLKLAVTLAIFAGIFVEFGGGYVAVDKATLDAPGEFMTANPAFPGIVGRLRARLTGQHLPEPRVPVSEREVCQVGAERPVFVSAADGSIRQFKASRHCNGAELSTVYERTADGRFVAVPLRQAGTPVYFRVQGLQLVPADLSDIWNEVRDLRLAVFLPWFFAAMAIKLLGIFANVWRWQILLDGQGIELEFGFLSSTYFIGRYFGIVAPSTMGLDAWRLYETIRLTRRPVECATTLVVERILGLVALFALILVFMPFAGRLTHGQSFGELVGALKVPFAGTVLLAVLVLLQPAWFRRVVRVIPNARVRRFVGEIIDAVTTYSTRRTQLLLALGLAVFGQLTTTLMYFANAMSLGTHDVRISEVLFASAVMTLGTFIAPSASGEGVRELVFVWLLGSKAGAAKAFLIGNLGFWIEKIPLSVPGGLLLLLRRDPMLHAVTRDDVAGLRAETLSARPRQADAGSVSP